MLPRDVEELVEAKLHELVASARYESLRPKLIPLFHRALSLPPEHALGRELEWTDIERVSKNDDARRRLALGVALAAVRAGELASGTWRRMPEDALHSVAARLPDGARTLLLDVHQGLLRDDEEELIRRGHSLLDGLVEEAKSRPSSRATTRAHAPQDRHARGAMLLIAAADKADPFMTFPIDLLENSRGSRDRPKHFAPLVSIVARERGYRIEPAHGSSHSKARTAPKGAYRAFCATARDQAAIAVELKEPAGRARS